MHDLAGVDPSVFDDIYTDIARKLLSEQLETGQIHDGLYQETAGQLMDAINGGLGGATFEYEDSRNVLRSSLMRNIYQFSAAKSLVELEQFRSMMLDSEGAVKPFYKFRQSIAATGKLFNDTYLRTEYDTAKQSAIMAHRWQSLQAEYLEYNTVGDERVRGEHKALDGKTYPKDHSFWNNAMPPLGWNCRCTVIPGLARNYKPGNEKEDGQIVKPLVKGTIFDNNVGTSEIVFTEGHPYYSAGPKAGKQLKAEDYGLRTADKILEKPHPEMKAVESKEEYSSMFDSMANHRTGIVLSDPIGQKILFEDAALPGSNKTVDNNFKQHLLSRGETDRYKLLPNLKDIIESPDEIWSVIKPNDKQAVTTHYIKYYTGEPIVVMSHLNIGKTMFKLNKTGLATRQGILLYRK